MRLIINLARAINLIYYHWRFILEKLSLKTQWSREVGSYFGLTQVEVEKTAAKKRREAAILWEKHRRSSEKEIQSFYQETDYYVFRQTYFHRLKIYLDLALPLLFKRHGKFCEYGGGIGPFTNWLLPRFSGWRFTIVDLNCPVLKFARWRFRNKLRVNFKIVTPRGLPLTERYDVITCKQVLEHVSQPLSVVKHLVNHLNVGGWLFLDYVNNPGRENLESSANQRRLVLKLLKDNLHPIFAIDPEKNNEGYGLYVKVE